MRCLKLSPLTSSLNAEVDLALRRMCDGVATKLNVLTDKKEKQDKVLMRDLESLCYCWWSKWVEDCGVIKHFQQYIHPSWPVGLTEHQNTENQEESHMHISYLWAVQEKTSHPAGIYHKWHKLDFSHTLQNQNLFIYPQGETFLLQT